MKRRAANGFSLVEVIVAIAVLGVILVAVGGLMTGNLTLRRSSNRATEAIQISSSYLEAIKRHWTVLDNFVNESMPPAPEDPRAENYWFRVDIVCVDLDGTVLSVCPPIPELRQVRVTAYETDWEANPDATVLESIVTQIGRPFDAQGSE